MFLMSMVCPLQVFADTERQGFHIPKVGGLVMTQDGNNDRVSSRPSSTTSTPSTLIPPLPNHTLNIKCTPMLLATANAFPNPKPKRK